MNKIFTKICYILQFCYDIGSNTAQASNTNCAIWGQETLSAETASKWFGRLCSGNSNVTDASGSDRLVTKEVNNIENCADP